MPIGRAALEELRLKLQAKQAAVRAEVQKEQEEVLQVREREGAGCSVVCAVASVECGPAGS